MEKQNVANETFIDRLTRNEAKNNEVPPLLSVHENVIDLSLQTEVGENSNFPGCLKELMENIKKEVMINSNAEPKIEIPDGSALNTANNKFNTHQPCSTQSLANDNENRMEETKVSNPEITVPLICENIIDSPSKMEVDDNSNLPDCLNNLEIVEYIKKEVMTNSNVESKIEIPDETALDTVDNQFKTQSLANGNENHMEESKASNPEITVPLFDRNVITNDDKPFPYYYDVAKRLNVEKSFREKDIIPKLSYHEWKKQQDARTEEEKVLDKKNKRIYAIKIAIRLTKLSVLILKQLSQDQPDEAKLIEYFEKFLDMCVTPLAVLFTPQFVHTVMFCRGCNEFSEPIRSIADECYHKCHVMFPLPAGLNFEMVYALQVRKTVPDVCDRMEHIPLEYGDYDSTDESFDENSDENSVSNP